MTLKWEEGGYEEKKQLKWEHHSLAVISIQVVYVLNFFSLVCNFRSSLGYAYLPRIEICQIELLNFVLLHLHFLVSAKWLAEIYALCMFTLNKHYFTPSLSIERAHSETNHAIIKIFFRTTAHFYFFVVVLFNLYTY